ncbi:testis-expressed protein 36 [Chamaea fasciata]|uniref:testis-expressed protein 36 n=1 Tax=Chamaea fasciata TaxID=190680 RepID=UPI00336AEC1A
MARERSGNGPGTEREQNREGTAGAEPLPGGGRPGTATSREIYREGAGRAGSEGGAHSSRSSAARRRRGLRGSRRSAGAAPSSRRQLCRQLCREPRGPGRSDPGRQGHRAMANNAGGKANVQHGADWFVHEGEQGVLESTTSASLRHILDTTAALGTEYRQPLECQAPVEKAGNNHFPFSSHDNRHDICNAIEYFDLGMGVRKLDPERRKQNSHNLLEWASAPDESGNDDLLTIYQTSFVADQSPAGNEGCCARRYPKHHTQRQCTPQKECTAQKTVRRPERVLPRQSCS